MATINNDYSNLFNSIGFGQTSSGSSASLDNFYGDYASIKNGSYGKLLKAYYKKQENAAKADEADENKATYTKIKSNSASLSDAADALTSSSLYNKGSFQVTKADGTKEDAEYDFDKIGEKVSAFIDSYNSTVKAGASLEKGAAATRTLSLISFTQKHSSTLKSIGISVDKDGALSLDKDKLKSADISSIKSLFSGTGSYASTVANKADIISSLASKQLNTYSSYNSAGSYDTSATKSLFSDYT